CVDEDEDGHGIGIGCRGVDCDDDDPTRNAGATETCDGADDDCDGMTDEGCGCAEGETRACGSDVGACTPGVETCAAGAFGPCEDADAAGAETCNDADDDCNGTVDDGFGVGTPCDGPDADLCEEGTTVCDGAAATRCSDATGDSVETCNGSDDDCDGATDEGFMLGVGCDGSDGDLCEEGVTECDGMGGTRCSDTTGTNAEPCNGADDDCDGMT
ncbi:MAG: hypothetical protein KC620_26740, partial [Myxococcales bacterium]|nr:hypothetical protein [Myxococcales bacterium]